MNKTFPSFGCGIALRNELESFIFKHSDNIDFVEIFPDSFMPYILTSKNKSLLLKNLLEKFNVVVHGVNLSIGSERMDEEYLRKIKTVCDITCSPYYSDHLAITNVSNISLGHFSPIYCSDKMLKRIISNIRYTQDYIERPLLLENISYHFILNDSPYDEADFLNTLANETGCGILLDLANLNANSINHKFDPYIYINKLEGKNIAQYHIAGGEYGKTGYLYDSHNNIVEASTWQLLNYALHKSPTTSILLEHDQDYLSEEHYILQLSLAKKMLLACNNSYERQG